MENKVLCGCHHVTLQDVKDQIELGVNTFKELQEKTKIGTDCPPCKEQNEALFNQLISKKNN